MIINEICYARAGLVGNPSDIFNGKTISLLFDSFYANIKLYETPKLTILPGKRDLIQFDGINELLQYRRQFGYYGGLRLIEAIIIQFKEYCNQNGIQLDNRNFTIEYNSTIPFGVGLGGSSAIIKAVFSSLLKFNSLTEKDIPKPVQPNIILEAETKELGINAGPQDRVVVVYGGLVYMDFTHKAYSKNNNLHGDYEKMDPDLLPPLFIAYKEELSKSSGSVHNIMRYRATVEHDEKVLEVMRRKAALVDKAKTAFLKGEKHKLGPILTEDFTLRKSVYNITPENMKIIDIAVELGAHAKQTGSGGAAIGVYEDESHFIKLEKAYKENGFSIIKVNVVD